MPQASSSLHENAEALSPELLDRHRALVSLLEELEAIDWYDQRAAVCRDPELQRILIHNRDEEKEHAAMTLEWLRRQDPQLDAHLRNHLFRDGEIAVEEPTPDEERAPRASAGSLQIGSLRVRAEP